MPDVMDLFPELKTLDVLPLQIRRDQLLAVPEPKPDPVLQELCCVLRLLRGKAPGSSGRKSSSGERKVAPSLDML